MPNLLQMQLLQQQMLANGGGGGYMDGFEDEMYDMYDPMLYWMEGYGHGNAHGQFQGFEQAQYYQMLQQMQQMQMAQRMQTMAYGGAHGMRVPRRRGWKAMARMRLMGGMGGGIGMRGMGGGIAMMGSPFGMDAMRGNQLALMNNPWGGG